MDSSSVAAYELVRALGHVGQRTFCVVFMICLGEVAAEN